MLTNLTTKTFEGVSQVVDLNFNVAKKSLEESTAAAKQMMSIKDPQEFMALAAAHAQPSAEKALAYGRHLITIASGLQSEFTKAAEQQITETSRKSLELVEELTKHAPAGAENAVAILKSAISNANAGYEQLSKTTKQAAEVMEANLTSAVNQFTQPVAKARPKK
jgi:phasin family protein